jgi:hypothetical protein
MKSVQGAGCRVQGDDLTSLDQRANLANEDGRPGDTLHPAPCTLHVFLGDSPPR